MKALSIKQPWASLIASGRKTIELRSWRVNHRGPLLVCSGVVPRIGTSYPIGPLGVAICIVDLVDVVSATDVWRARLDVEREACCKPSPRDHAWVLENPRAVPNVPISGRLGLFDVDDALLDLEGFAA